MREGVGGAGRAAHIERGVGGVGVRFELDEVVAASAAYADNTPLTRRPRCENLLVCAEWVCGLFAQGCGCVVRAHSAYQSLERCNGVRPTDRVSTNPGCWSNEHQHALKP